MAPFFDERQNHVAIAAHALPAIEGLAANPEHLGRALENRFNRSDPPPYESSESETEEALLYHPVLAPTFGAVSNEYKDLIEAPLNDDELSKIVWYMRDGYHPGRRYKREAIREKERVRDWSRKFHPAFFPYGSPHRLWELFKGVTTGGQRLDVIVRHNIRKRWQRLGVWNPDWGIPDRVNKQPNDNVDSWRWKWQQSSPPKFHMDGNLELFPQDPTVRAIQLRRGLAYHETNPLPPRSRLHDDASASQAESFITSRPWFMYSLEIAEDFERNNRIPAGVRWRPNDDNDELGPIERLWEERGDWKEDWDSLNIEVVGWKWRHESPSPEPEDMTPFETDDFDFTPSEIDAFESVPVSTPRRTPSPVLPFYRMQNAGPPNKNGRLFGYPDRTDELENGSVAATSPEIANRASNSGPASNVSSAPGRPSRADHRPLPSEAPTANPRRSSRVAARRNAAHAPGFAPAVSRSRPVPARPPPSAVEKPKKTRGRPRKESGAVTKTLSQPAEIQKKKTRGRPPKTAGTMAKTPSEPAEMETKKPRGRPPKTEGATTKTPSEPAAMQTKKPRGRPPKTSGAVTKASSQPAEMQKTKTRGRPLKTAGATTKTPSQPPTRRGERSKVGAVAAVEVDAGPFVIPKRGRGRPKAKIAPVNAEPPVQAKETRVATRRKAPVATPEAPPQDTGRPRRLKAPVGDPQVEPTVEPTPRPGIRKRNAAVAALDADASAELSPATKRPRGRPRKEAAV